MKVTSFVCCLIEGAVWSDLLGGHQDAGFHDGVPPSLQQEPQNQRQGPVWVPVRPQGVQEYAKDITCAYD